MSRCPAKERYTGLPCSLTWPHDSAHKANVPGGALTWEGDEGYAMAPDPITTEIPAFQPQQTGPIGPWAANVVDDMPTAAEDKAALVKWWADSPPVTVFIPWLRLDGYDD